MLSLATPSEMQDRVLAAIDEWPRLADTANFFGGAPTPRAIFGILSLDGSEQRLCGDFREGAIAMDSGWGPQDVGDPCDDEGQESPEPGQDLSDVVPAAAEHSEDGVAGGSLQGAA